MELTLKYFGSIVDITMKKEEAFFVEEEAITLKSLQLRIEVKYPKILVVSYSMAVNKKFLQNDVLLINRDVVAFLPPFAGG